MSFLFSLAFQVREYYFFLEGQHIILFSLNTWVMDVSHLMRSMVSVHNSFG